MSAILILARYLALGAIAGALFLGGGGRVVMRLFAVTTGRPGAFTMRGTLTVVTVGALFGLGGGLLRGILDRPLRRFVHGLWARAFVFGALFFALASPGVRPPWIRNFALFGACFLAYAVALEWLAERVPRRPRATAGSVPSANTLVIRLLPVILGVTIGNTLEAQTPRAIGIFESQSDVGRARRGAATYDATLQRYNIAGSGQNMWNDRDDFHYVWKRLTGNFILSTRARFRGAGVDPHRKIGWSIRPSLDPGSAHVTAALHGNGLMSLQYRRDAGAVTEEQKSQDSLPNADAVIQLERRDGAYIMSVAQFGDTLVTQELTGVSLPDTVYVGLFVCAHNDGIVERATFSNVRITVPAGPKLVPYRDYLGSNLEILDLASGNATIVHRYHGSFQAPNWTPDGRALIYAQEGRLYRYDLSSKSATSINTGFATRNNNDHVLSFDGRMLGISHHAAEDSGASIVYTVPVSGGTPKRVTTKGPSYLHGWSPDGRWLVFTGQRNGDFDVYKIPSAGGEEIRLTTTPGLDDGPEFSPDGGYIYFNSARTGRMQIWRMRPDGSEQQQLTDDRFNNWFPHVSPDGRSIVFISFPPDVAADDHPFYKHVLLRLMPIAGGASRVIAYVYGGQGTINVPSWSPDGKRLAFVSNTGTQERP